MNDLKCPHCGSARLTVMRHGKTAPAKDGGLWVTTRFKCLDCNRPHWESRKVKNER